MLDEWQGYYHHKEQFRAAKGRLVQLDDYTSMSAEQRLKYVASQMDNDSLEYCFIYEPPSGNAWNESFIKAAREELAERILLDNFDSSVEESIVEN